MNGLQYRLPPKKTAVTSILSYKSQLNKKHAIERGEKKRLKRWKGVAQNRTSSITQMRRKELPPVNHAKKKPAKQPKKQGIVRRPPFTQISPFSIFIKKSRGNIKKCEFYYFFGTVRKPNLAVCRAREVRSSYQRISIHVDGEFGESGKRGCDNHQYNIPARSLFKSIPFFSYKFSWRW